MDRSIKAPGGGDDQGVKSLIATGAGFGLIEGAGASIRIGEALYGGPEQDVTLHPLHLVIELMTGQLQWTTAATGGAVTLVAGLAGTALGSAWAWGRLCDKCADLRKGRKDRPRKKTKEKIDERARYMGRGKELVGLGYAAVAAKAAQLKVQLGDGDEPGVLIGRAVVDGQRLYASYEDLHLDIWGPRQGKSTSRVIPAVLEAVGPVVSTSNKRDVVDATAALREKQHGGRSWVFDPQGIAGQTPTWHWDPAAWVLGVDGDGAEERATELAGIFAASGETSSGDAFFEPEGEDLLAALFLACAIGKRPITDAYKWVTDSEDKTPIKILDATNGQFEEFAAGLASQYAAPERQRAGVFSTAKKMAACLKYSKIRRWVTPAAVDEAPRQAFDVADFVTSRDTLYLLSGEKKGNAGPLITAFAAAIADAGEKEGNRHPGGRLPVPLLIVLDEAANIVRWPSLPKQYSHFGSRGMVVITILQSWAQGVRCWGSEGMGALWSAANVKVLGSGLDDAAFLRDRSELIGDHYELVNALSKSQGNRSVSTSRVTERTLTSSDLTAIPRGRAVLFSAGRPAVLIAPVPWMDRPYAAEVRDAIKDAETASANTRVSDPKSARARRLHVVPTTDQKGRTA
ncbi:type IV secretory system conjugative DNA transfer family protein [Nocardia neocaledoniensis]|uniref:type IV secretory system conjugative DNA transfer family protein n=1 Tax=Nocardia neocaledoniensis TaxID=236511 RepID=UPI0024576EB6|nr:TraM recognition domain-containing protein [Nocardia neocaledoniensis]